MEYKKTGLKWCDAQNISDNLQAKNISFLLCVSSRGNIEIIIDGRNIADAEKVTSGWINNGF